MRNRTNKAWIRLAFLLGLTAVFGTAVSAAAPRLLAVVVVDQMRAEFLERGAPGGGLERLRREGAVFTQARLGYVPTETGPGHAIVLTGRYPSEHGIVANDWWDGSTRRSIYCADDLLFGRGPGLLESYTLGDALKAQHPRSRVVTVSVKDRAAIFLGGQRPDHAIWFNKVAGEFTTSEYYKRPRWLGGLNKSLKKRGGPLYGVPPADYIGASESAVGDELVLRAAFAALEREKLGRDAEPDLLGVSFSATDYVGHAWGADGAEMDAQLSALDKNLARLFDELDDRVGKGRWSLALTADHGSTPAPWSARGQELRLRALTYEELDKRVERAMQYQYPSKTRWIEASRFPHVWLSTAGVAATGLDRTQLLRAAARALAEVPDVAAVYIPGELAADDAYAGPYGRSIYPGRSGDLLLRLLPDVALAETKRGAHGSVYELDARVPLVFMGAGFAPGRHEGPAAVADLAPTAATALAVTFDGGKHARPLIQALSPRVP